MACLMGLTGCGDRERQTDRGGERLHTSLNYPCKSEDIHQGAAEGNRRGAAETVATVIKLQWKSPVVIARNGLLIAWLQIHVFFSMHYIYSIVHTE